MKKLTQRYGLMQKEIEKFMNFLQKNNYHFEAIGDAANIINNETKCEEGLIAFPIGFGPGTGGFMEAKRKIEGDLQLHIYGDAQLENVVAEYYKTHKEWFEE